MAVVGDPGGSILRAATDTRYGRLAAAVDPTGVNPRQRRIAVGRREGAREDSACTVQPTRCLVGVRVVLGANLPHPPSAPTEQAAFLNRAATTDAGSRSSCRDGRRARFVVFEALDEREIAAPRESPRFPTRSRTTPAARSELLGARSQARQRDRKASTAHGVPSLRRTPRADSRLDL